MEVCKGIRKELFEAGSVENTNGGLNARVKLLIQNVKFLSSALIQSGFETCR